MTLLITSSLEVREMLSNERNQGKEYSVRTVLLLEPSKTRRLLILVACISIKLGNLTVKSMKS